MLTWALRIFLGFAGVVALIALVTGGLFFAWRSEAVADLERDPLPRIAETAHGPVQYAVIGEGLPYLALHGTPGGYDQAVAGRRDGGDTGGLMVIALSRPGYLGTPLESGQTYEEQADLFAALLDELGVDRAVVFGASGGGRAALQFALRHPDRTLGLILYAPELTSAPEEGPGEIPPMSPVTMTLLEGVMWAVGGPLGPAMIEGYDPSDPDQRAALRAMTRTSIPWSRRAEGQRNDVIQRLDPAVNAWPLEDIAAPALILHGDADANSDYEDSVALAGRLPDAELVTFEGGDHYLMLTRADELQAHMDRFLDRFR